MYRQQVQTEGSDIAKLENQIESLKKAWFEDCRRRKERQLLAQQEAYDAALLEKIPRSPTGEAGSRQSRRIVIGIKYDGSQSQGSTVGKQDEGDNPMAILSPAQ